MVIISKDWVLINQINWQRKQIKFIWMSKYQYCNISTEKTTIWFWILTVFGYHNYAGIPVIQLLVKGYLPHLSTQYTLYFSINLAKSVWILGECKIKGHFIYIVLCWPSTRGFQMTLLRNVIIGTWLNHSHLGGSCLDWVGRTRYPRYHKIKISGDSGHQSVI